MTTFPTTWTTAQEWQDYYPSSVVEYCEERGIIDVPDNRRVDILFISSRLRTGTSRDEVIKTLRGLSGNQILVEHIEAVLDKRTFHDNEAAVLGWLEEQRQVWRRALNVVLFNHYIKPLDLGTCHYSGWEAILNRTKQFGWEAKEREQAAIALACFLEALTRPKQPDEGVL